MSEKPIQWMTTAPNPNVRGYGADDGQRGWRMHAVRADDSETFGAVKDRIALCGRRAAHGWGLDMFVDRPCSRCAVKAGIACSTCKGKGRGPKPNYTTCGDCAGTGKTLAARKARR